MWYVIQVPTGRERQMIEAMGSYEVQPFCEEIFCPRRQYKKKYLGQWHLEEEILFPGYLFVISDQAEELYQALKRIPRLTKLLGTGEKWTPMSPEDVEIVERLSGRRWQGNEKARGLSEKASEDSWVMEFSEGYMEGDRVIVTDGPLQGLESRICRVDRHKRLAWLAVELFGRTVEVQAGLEIVRRE